MHLQRKMGFWAFTSLVAGSQIGTLNAWVLTSGQIALGGVALLFCGWALYSSGIKMIGLASLITLAGLPLYLWKKRIREQAAETKI